MDEIAKTGYDIAIKLTDKTARTVWSVYGGLLAANGFLVTLATFLLAQSIVKVSFIRSLGGLGLLLCLAWFLITMRNFDFYRYYFAWARKLEEQAFGDAVQIVRGGAVFARGESYQIGSAIERMRWGSRLFKVEWLVYVVIATFAAIYAYLVAAQ